MRLYTRLLGGILLATYFLFFLQNRKFAPQFTVIAVDIGVIGRSTSSDVI